MKAKTSESDYAAIVAALRLVSHTEDREYAQHADLLAWKKGPNTQWDPSASTEGTMISHHYNWWEIVKYEKGFLYYEVLNTEGP